MKKIVSIFIAFMLLVTPAFAFLYEGFVPMTEEQIKKLADKALFDAYVDAQITRKAAEQFHEAAGFSNAKEFNKYKELLRQIFQLRLEMDRRESLDPDTVDENMR